MVKCRGMLSSEFSRFVFIVNLIVDLLLKLHINLD